MDYLTRLADNTLAYIAARIDDVSFVESYPDLYEGVQLLDEDRLLRKQNEILTSSDAISYINTVKLCGNNLGSMLLQFCLTAFLKPSFLELFRESYGGSITIEAVAHIMGLQEDYESFLQVKESAYGILYHEKSYLPYFRYPVSMDEKLFHHIIGKDELDKRLIELGANVFTLSEELNEMYAGQEWFDEICNGLTNPYTNQCIMHIAGENGCGKRFLLQHACKQIGLEMIFVDYNKIAARPEQERKQIIWLLSREMLLGERGLCYYHLSISSFQETKDAESFIHNYIEPHMGLKQPVCICSDLSVELVHIAGQYMEKVAIKEYSRSERLNIWKGYSRKYNMDNYIDCVNASSKYKLSAKEIANAVYRMMIRTNRGEKPDEAMISRCCFEVLPAPDQGSIKRIHVTYTLDDLKLAESQKQTIFDICSHVRYRYKVYTEWEMESKFAYGRNVSALFIGSPGTGKTMAVHVLSNMLDLPLYRVDLSQVVDKYIGETEKKLEEIFNLAEKSNTILFFDEADAIFGKRSEVQDAKDRYANTEVSYILQRMEQYDGIVILASNYKQNIDEAFMRRIRYLVDFHLPDEELRRQIWQGSFTKAIPTDYIDFDFLARKFELSGGSIKNIVLNAAFLAADDKEAVAMKHIVKSIKNENLKFGKVSMPEDFDEYYYE